MANMESGRPGIMFYFDVLPCLERLGKEEIGELFWAIMNYARFGVLPELEGVLGLAFDFMRPRIDLDAEAYEMKREANRRNALARWHGKPDAKNAAAYEAMPAMPNTDSDSEPESDSNTDTDSKANSRANTKTDSCCCNGDKPPTTTTLPTREEVKRYCQEQGYPIDWDYFYDYYTGNGWKTGKNPVSDWKAVVRNWARKEKNHERTDKNQFSEFGPIGIVL